MILNNPVLVCRVDVDGRMDASLVPFLLLTHRSLDDNRPRLAPETGTHFDDDDDDDRPLTRSPARPPARPSLLLMPDQQLTTTQDNNDNNDNFQSIRHTSSAANLARLAETQDKRLVSEVR